MRKRTKGSEVILRRFNREFSILSTISQTINQSVDLDEILNNSLDRIKELTDVSFVGLFLLKEGEDTLTLAAQRGFSRTFVKGMRTLSLGQGVTGKAALSGEPFFVEDYENCPDAQPLALEEGVKSLVVIPLKLKTTRYGTLSVAWKERHLFDTFEKNLYSSIGEMISSGMERAFLYTENVKRLEEQNTLYSISQEIASRLELEVILRKIVEKAIDLLGMDAGEITLWDHRRQDYVSAIVYGLPRSPVEGEEAPSVLREIVGEICSRKAPVCDWEDEHHPPRWSELKRYQLKGILGVPLNLQQMIIGTMVIATSDPKKRFRQKEVELLSSFAHQAAIAIGNAKLYEDSLNKIKGLTALYEIGKTLSSTLDLDVLLKGALKHLRELLGSPQCAFLFLDKKREELFIRQVIGIDDLRIQNRRFRVGVGGIIGRVASTGQPIYVPDVSKDPRCVEGLGGGRSEAAFPLKIRDEVIGVLDVQSKEVMGFDEEDLKVLSSFASQVGISIENARLFSDLKRTLRELRQAQDQIIQAEKLRALGEMASGVAHDFNNALAVILGNVQLLLYQLDRLPLEEVREQLRIIERASKDAAGTVRRIQEFTGVRRDREFSIVSPNEIIREVVTVTQPRWKDQAQLKGIQIQLDTELEDVPPVFGDPSELREVLTNILFNAVEAMPQGGQITISSRPREHWVELRVTDTGMGMTEEVKKRIFDPFFTTKGVTNSGLGMSVSYGIVKRHGGEILFESEPGKGSTFRVHLPKMLAEEEMEKTAGPLRDCSPARILVIDDDESVRDVLFRILKTKGHEVVVVSSGEEGIERFRSEPFDLVLTDLGMSRVTGWDVGKAVKHLNPNVPVGMITGWGMELSREKMTEHGIDLVVSKPFGFNQVIHLVSEALEWKNRI